MEAPLDLLRIAIVLAAALGWGALAFAAWVFAKQRRARRKKRRDE